MRRLNACIDSWKRHFIDWIFFRVRVPQLVRRDLRALAKGPGRSAPAAGEAMEPGASRSNPELADLSSIGTSAENVSDMLKTLARFYERWEGAPPADETEGSRLTDPAMGIPWDEPGENTAAEIKAAKNAILQRHEQGMDVVEKVEAMLRGYIEADVITAADIDEARGHPLGTFNKAADAICRETFIKPTDECAAGRHDQCPANNNPVKLPNGGVSYALCSCPHHTPPSWKNF